MDKARQILIDIKNRKIKPIYFLMGEEPFYIDKIAEYIEQKVLTEQEKGFNQMVLYGRDVTIEDIVSHAKRYPMLSDYQVIIVKEAQELSRSIEKLVAYAEQPQNTTILVFCYKYKTLDKRKKLHKTISKNGLIFESKKLYDNQVADWIKQTVTAKKHQIEPKAIQMLVEFLGTDLTKINNELSKLQLVIPKQTPITPLLIEKNIGFSKDYNNFELRKAIGARDFVRATKIIRYFGQNPKDNPIVVTVSMLFGFFAQLLQYHGTADKSAKNIASVLKINPFFVKEYQQAAQNFPMKKVSAIIAKLREIDVKSKGVGATKTSPEDLLKELLVTIQL